MFSKIIDRFTTRRALWVLGCAAACLFLFFNVSPFGVPRFRQYTHISGPGAGMLDLQFACSPEQMYRLLTEYGEGGRRYYFILLAVDFIFPAVYGLFLAGIVRVLARRAFSSDSKWQNLYVIPLLAAVCDYLENFGILTLLLTYPRRLLGVALITSIFTTSKWILSGVSALAIAAVGVKNRLSMNKDGS